MMKTANRSDNGSDSVYVVKVEEESGRMGP